MLEERRTVQGLCFSFSNLLDPTLGTLAGQASDGALKPAYREKVMLFIHTHLG